MRHPCGFSPPLVAPIHDDEEDNDSQCTDNNEGDSVAVGEVGVGSIRGVVGVVVVVAAILVAVVGVPVDAGPVGVAALLWARRGDAVGV